MLIRPTRRELLRASAALGGAAALAAARPNDPWGQARAIAASLRRPVFPARAFPITAFGAR